MGKIGEKIMKILKRNLFPRNLEIVARELLGKILVRKFENKNFSGRIVEDEA